jgi:hypothetical protein
LATKTRRETFDIHMMAMSARQLHRLTLQLCDAPVHKSVRTICRLPLCIANL